MSEKLDNQGWDHGTLFRSLCGRWRELCELYLPVKVRGSIWRYSRGLSRRDPEQGWKLHISTSAPTASTVLEKIAPCLSRCHLLYKVPVSLQELEKLNSGIYYGYCQVGKVITVYPQTTEEAVRLARALHRLTRDTPAPAVPFDLKFRPDGCLYYRYGSFSSLEKENADGTRTLAIRDPDGNLVADRRDAERAMPDWVTDPFPLKHPPRTKKVLETPLKKRFRAFCALSQRGKGGVYKALDLSASPPRFCILKEGRKNGETGLDGLDGYDRVKHEGRVLKALHSAGLGVPRLYSSFKGDQNYYLALEYIEGETLDKWLGKRKRRLAISRALHYGIEISNVVARIHLAGWVWRDCKLTNLMVTKQGEMRPLDFEGACPVDRPDPMPWGSPSYVPPEWCDQFRGQSRVPEDLYALGVIMYLLLTGCLPEASPLLPIEKLRRDVPPAITEIVMRLLDADPARRPCAGVAARRLQAALSQLTA
ncbi:MAG TPA: protein kinase [Pyrinomonadaceae bacterium]|nr:protein kinase [Pyrinomonadaceae bacterium]